MKLYYSDIQTRFYTQSIDMNVVAGVKIPDYVTTNPIPENIPANKIAYLNPDKTWKLVDHPDFITVYNKTNQEELIVNKNQIPDGYTLVKPNAVGLIFHSGKWDSEENIKSELKKQIINKINFKTRTKIESGYESSILGKPYIYDSSLTDQFEIDFLSRQDSDFEIKCTGPDGIKKRILHTKEQIKSLATEFLVYVSGLKVVADSEKTGILESDYTIEELETILKQ